MKTSVFDDTSEQARGTQKPLSRRRDRAIRVVAFGGGTGLANLLKGLKRYVRPPGGMSTLAGIIENLCAVVAVTDDGGSSGRLRKELNVLPPGDIRNCITALSEDQALLPRLFQHRFRSGTGLDGHSFGNLFLTALASMTGDFAEAVKQCSDILAISGHVYPATNSDVQVEAIMSDGNRVRGETGITASTGRIVEIQLVPADARALPQTIEAIACADLITIGPGSLFTSLVPNLLVEGISEALVTSRASRVLICNLMTQANESIGLTAADHVRVLHRHARVKFIDYVMLNTKPASPGLKAIYAQQGCSQINVDFEALEVFGLKVILNDYLEEVDGIARHASDRVAGDLLRLARKVARGEHLNRRRPAAMPRRIFMLTSARKIAEAGDGGKTGQPAPQTGNEEPTSEKSVRAKTIPELRVGNRGNPALQRPRGTTEQERAPDRPPENWPLGKRECRPPRGSKG